MPICSPNILKWPNAAQGIAFVVDVITYTLYRGHSGVVDIVAIALRPPVWIFTQLRCDC